MMQRTEIVFVRHGQTRSNIEGLLHGRTDEPLNAHGWWQVERVAIRLGATGPLHSIHASPLSRALATAQAIANQTGAAITKHDDLAEFHFGDFEGYTLSQIQQSHPELYGKMFEFSDRAFRFPNGESRGEFYDRTLSAVQRLIDGYAGERFAVVAHEGVIASVVTQLTGNDPSDWTRNRFDNCSITTVAINGSAVAEVTCWNDTIHLEDARVKR